MNLFGKGTLVALTFAFGLSAQAANKAQLLARCEMPTTAKAAIDEILAQSGLSMDAVTSVEALKGITAEDFKKATPEQLALLQKKIQPLNLLLKVSKVALVNSIKATQQIHGKNDVIALAGSTMVTTFDYAQILIEAIDVALKYRNHQQEVPAAEAQALQKRATDIVSRLTSLSTEANGLNSKLMSMSTAERNKTQVALSYLNDRGTIEMCRGIVNAFAK